MDIPQFEFVCEINVNVGEAQEIGDTGTGIRKIIPLLGGTFKGPKMEGVILPGGADWQLIKKNNVADVDARYTLETKDGSLIFLSNKGLRVASEEVLKKLANGEKVNVTEYYFRTIPVFETAIGKYDWLMRSLFIANGIRNPDNVIIEVWRMMDSSAIFFEKSRKMNAYIVDGIRTPIGSSWRRFIACSCR